MFANFGIKVWNGRRQPHDDGRKEVSDDRDSSSQAPYGERTRTSRTLSRDSQNARGRRRREDGRARMPLSCLPCPFIVFSYNFLSIMVVPPRTYRKDKEK